MSERDGLDDLIAVIRSRNARARQREVDAAVQTALTRYAAWPLPRRKIPSWFAMGRLPALRDEVLTAWREQHA